MDNSRKSELISRVLEQVSALPRSRLRDGITVQVIKALRSGGRISIFGCLALGEIKRPSKKGGFRNGTCVLRPTIPALDHEKSSHRRIKIPTCEIVDILVRA